VIPTPYYAPALLASALAFGTCTVFVRDAWAAGSFEVSVLAMLGAAALGLDWRNRPQLSGYAPALLPLWGLLQIVTGATSSASDTRSAVVRLGALAAVYVLAFRVAEFDSARHLFLELFLWFAIVSAILCLTQLFTSGGKVLWKFDTGYQVVYGTFPSYNNYAQFVELALPVALWRALTNPRRAWAYAMGGGALYASAIGSASRAGSVLTTLELAVILLIGLARHQDTANGKGHRVGTVMLAIAPAMAIMFTLVVGWERTWDRFLVNDPYIGHRELATAATEMAKQRPFIGFGLDTFPAVYPKYAVKDFPAYANHAHNDWAEAAAEGGFPFLAALFIPFAMAAPKAIRHPWGLGLVAVMLHACVDYPFARPAVSGWMFALLGLLYAADADPAAPVD